MQFIKPQISTVCMGMVASMASVIASSGTKGKRFILPHSRFLVHQPLGGAKGQCSDIQIEAKEIQILKEELQHILAENSGQDYETIEKMCDRDTILTAQEAVDYGFVDSIVSNKKNII
jgi:ATP-dependent Clp protease protease subunit